jgi:putative ABC transport system permease protein
MKLYKLKVTIRNARKNGVLSFAKLFGLSLSMAVILFAVGYVYFETSFDKSVPNSDRIYRCLMQGKFNEEIVDYAVTSPAQAEAIKTDIPEITESIRVLGGGNADLKYNGSSFSGGQLYYADPAFFSFFGIPIKTHQGSPLASTNNLSIAKSLAEKQFGSVENALGKVVEIRDENCVITGVFNDLPKNFHLQIELVQSLQKSNPDQVGWGAQNYYTYFKTNRPNIDVAELNLKISKSVYTHYEDRIDGAKAKTMNDMKFAENIYLFYTCEPLRDIHFSNHKFDPAITANKTYVYGAIILAIIVLLISSVNFINLTIASVSTRLKEVGIRKTIGAGKGDIVIQFLYETLLFFSLSFVIAVFIYLLTGKPLTHYLGFDILLKERIVMKLVASVFAALLIFNLAVNIFPILLTSNRKILNLIRNDSATKRNHWGSQSFIIIQFVLSGLIILSSVIVQKQISFMANKDRGYDMENVMMFNAWEMKPETRKNFLEKLKANNDIQSVSTSDVYFGDDFGMNAAFFETREDKNYFHTSVLPVDDEFRNTFNFTISDGRFFDHERKTDFDAVVLNESAVKQYPGKGSLVGKIVLVGDKSYQVIGILKDFNFRSLHHPIEPLVMTLTENAGSIYLKIRNSRISGVVGILQKLWIEYNPNSQLNYQFHDEVLIRHYDKDQQAKKLLLLLSIISIAIACVGLYAISFFTIIRKTKEMGIRKVNGAKVSELMIMLNKGFLKWVAIAFIIATPIAYYAMNKWLENFAYKTSLSWWIFALAGLLALGIALLTVSWQSWKAATRNPVEALRYE